MTILRISGKCFVLVATVVMLLSFDGYKSRLSADDAESVTDDAGAMQEKEATREEPSPSNPVVLPQGYLFAPLIADPRWPHFSAAYHHYIDDEELESVGATSFGETIGLYRNDAFGGGEWQIGIQAGVFAIFNLDVESHDLVNADYHIGIPISYRLKDFSAMLNLFHQSSHLGDEYILRTRIDRVNLSYEGINIKSSYNFYTWLRLYGGGGYIFRVEPADLDPWSVQYGFEVVSPQAYAAGRLKFITGVDIKNWDEHDWDADISARAGIQIQSRAQVGTAGNIFQVMIEYFNGHSPNGQFYERSIQYLGLGTHFYF